jgi:hypothetical protein
MKQVSFGYEELVCMLHVLTSQYLNNIVFVSEGISGSKYLKLKQFWILFLASALRANGRTERMALKRVSNFSTRGT